jgi:hypothetical protein
MPFETQAEPDRQWPAAKVRGFKVWELSIKEFLLSKSIFISNRELWTHLDNTWVLTSRYWTLSLKQLLSQCPGGLTLLRVRSAYRLGIIQILASAREYVKIVNYAS